MGDDNPNPYARCVCGAITFEEACETLQWQETLQWDAYEEGGENMPDMDRLTYEILRDAIINDNPGAANDWGYPHCRWCDLMLVEYTDDEHKDTCLWLRLKREKDQEHAG